MIYEPMPSTEELKAELFYLAEQRLSNYPGAFKRFKNEPLGRSIIHSLSYKLLLLGLDTLAFHTAEARQARLLQIVDEWAKDRLKPIAPLHLSPDREHIAADMSPINTDGLVTWQAATLESWEEIKKSLGEKPSARRVLLWLRNNGPRDVFGDEQPNDRSALIWRDRDKNRHKLTLKRLGTVLSEWRNIGKI